MKYMGSKNRIAKDILPIMLKHRTKDQYWVEPFVGGANMIDKVTGNRIGSDFNKSLVKMWIDLQNGWIPPNYIRKTKWDKIRQNNVDSSLLGWCNTACSFNGIGKSYSGKIITKEGKKRNYQNESKRNVLKQIEYLKDVYFYNCSYQDLKIPNNSIIYCDPPYENTTGYITGEFNHAKFWRWVRKQVRKGHTVFISEYNAPKDFKCIWSKEVTTSLSITKGKKDIEKLFVHKRQYERLK